MGTTLIDMFLKYILPKLLKVVPFYYNPDTILYATATKSTEMVFEDYYVRINGYVIY